MSEEDKKIVIVVGAGASCDFVVPNLVEEKGTRLLLFSPI